MREDTITEVSAVYKLKFGLFLIKCGRDSVTGLESLKAEPLSFGCPNSLTENVSSQLSEYFEGKRRVFDFPYSLTGTDFQKMVWAELAAIPYGETRTYGQLAAAIGSPKAARAVGMAIHHNPVAIAVPCHRVIGAGGGLVGYAGGLEMKAALLRLEAEHSH